MKYWRFYLKTIMVLSVFLAFVPVAAQPYTELGTAFTYQGQLKQDGLPLNDSTDFIFTLLNVNGDPVGSSVQIDAVDVVNGLFSVELDFGAEAFSTYFDGPDEVGVTRSLRIELRSPAGVGDYIQLSPDQLLTPTPFALQTRGIIVDNEEGIGIGQTPWSGYKLMLLSKDRPAVKLEAETSKADAVARVLDLSTSADVAPQPGLGARLGWRLQTSNFGYAEAGAIDVAWDDPTLGSTNAHMVFKTNNADPQGHALEHMRITADGSVGIGTSSPSAKLHISAPASEGPPLEVESDGISVLRVNPLGSGIILGPTLQSAGLRIDGKMSVANDEPVADLSLETSTLGSPKMRFFEDRVAFVGQNRVGIGTESPAARLHIGGTPGVDGIMYPDGSLQTTAAVAPPALWGEIAGNIYNTNPGAVGIGTTLPLYPLHVAGTADRVISASNSSSTNYTSGVYGESGASNGYGVHGNASSSSGNSIGAYGESSSSSGRGVHGKATHGVGNFAYGVYGLAEGTMGRGVYGRNTAGSGTNFGVYGRVASPSGFAVFGEGGSGVGGKFTSTGNDGLQAESSSYNNAALRLTSSSEATGAIISHSTNNQVPALDINASGSASTAIDVNVSAGISTLASFTLQDSTSVSSAFAIDADTVGAAVEIKATNTGTNGGALIVRNAGSGDTVRAITNNTTEFIVGREGLHAKRAINMAASENMHVARIENTSTGTSPDVLALQTQSSDLTPSTAINFITFLRGTTSLGSIEGNNNGGVQLGGPGSDYAEYLEKADRNDALEPGDVVGVHTGKISRRTDGAHHVMVISTGPIVAGNAPGDEAELVRFEPVAFIGQAPVKVRGRVRAGDLIVASGSGDGTAVAVAPESATPEQLELFIGTAWESNGDLGIKRVNVAVGIQPAFAMKRAAHSASEIARQEQNGHTVCESLDKDKALARLRAEMETELQERSEQIERLSDQVALLKKLMSDTIAEGTLHGGKP